MRSITHLLLCLSLTASVFAQGEPQPSEDTVPSELNKEFQDLLNALPEESLHVALSNHLQPKFRDGVFEYDRKAVEAVHAADPPLATKLIIVAAKHDLIRRQNVSTSAPSPPPPPPTTSTPPVVLPTTNAPPTSNTVLPPTSAGRPTTALPTTNSPGSTPNTLLPPSTSGPARPTATSNGQSVQTTFSGDDFTTTPILATSTLPNGEVVTSTSFLTVPRSRPTDTPQGQATDAAGNPNLQNDAASWLPFQSSVIMIVSLVGALLL